MKEYTITMTSKGQFTMPVEVRRALGVSEKSNKLKIILNNKTNEASIKKPLDFDEISAIAKSYIKPGIEPLLDPRAFFETRKPRI